LKGRLTQEAEIPTAKRFYQGISAIVPFISDLMGGRAAPIFRKGRR
jgi:hypothetical protein